MVISLHIDSRGACDGGNFLVAQLVVIAHVEGQLLFCGQREDGPLQPDCLQITVIHISVSGHTARSAGRTVQRHLYAMSPLKNAQRFIGGNTVNPCTERTPALKLPEGTEHPYKSLLGGILCVVV